MLGKLGEHKLVANGVGVVSGKGNFFFWIFGLRVSEAGVAAYSEKIIISSEWPTRKRYIYMKCYYHWPRVKKKRCSYIVSPCQTCQMVKTVHQLFKGLLHNLLFPDWK